MNKIIKFLCYVGCTLNLVMMLVMATVISRQEPKALLCLSVSTVCFVMGLLILLSFDSTYKYKDKTYFLQGDGLMKHPTTRKWIAVKIYQTNGTKTLFVRESNEFNDRFEKQ